MIATSRRCIGLSACILIMCLAYAVAPAASRAIPTPPSAWPLTYLQTTFSGFVQPLFVTGDGTGARFYVVEKGGKIWVTPPDHQSLTLFLDLSAKVSTASERGLLGLAFDPDYDTTGEFYVNYTKTDGATVISRFSRNPADHDQALPVSEEVVLTFAQPYANHNGGCIAFGPDGYLYIASGDGGSGGDPNDNGQSLNTLLGKLLRIDVRGHATYVIPPTNPFASSSTARGEIWAYGLRNPWRFSFDSDGGLYIGDVGQNAWEELDYEPPGSAGGRNYGWNTWEGNHAYPPGTTAPSRTGFTFPVWEYANPSVGEAIVGGYLYEGTRFPGLRGTYFAGDYEVGKIWGLRRSGSTWNTRLLLDSTAWFSSFGENDAGDVFAVGFLDGKVYRVADADYYSTRIADATRYSTAVRIARTTYPGWAGVTDVVIASGEDRAAADPLAAAGLCWAYDAPLLLMNSSYTPSEVKVAIREIAVANPGGVTVRVVGGSTSVPTKRLDEIMSYVNATVGPGRVTMRRVLATGDRYDLARAIAAQMRAARSGDTTTTVMIANGADPAKFFDAMALSAVSARTGAPILLVAKNAVPTATRNALAEIGATRIVVAGGTATVSSATYARLAATERWSGPTRYDTAVDIARKAEAAGWLDSATVGVAARLPDGLTGGVLLGKRGGPMLVTAGAPLSDATKHYLEQKRASVTTGFVLGGTASITDATRISVARALD